jgi:hypothetical protein
VPAFQAVTQAAAPKKNPPKKNKGSRITKHNVIPTAEPGRPDKSGRGASLGHAPGAVIFAPFVASPELTRG